MRTRGSGRRLILALGLAASCSGCAGSGKASGLPVKDDFANCSKGWSTDEDEFVSLSCTDGGYRVFIKNPVLPQNARIFFSERVESLAIETDATRRAGPTTVGSDDFLIYGVGCWRSQVQGYVFLISPDGAWGIEKATTGTSTPRTLAESETPNAIPGLAKTNRIRGLCVGGGREPTRLALFVNGKKIAAAEDRDGFDSFPGFGLFVFSSKQGTDVRFDNVLARKLTNAEVRPSREKPATAHLTPSICKRAGIRYAGTTAQGAEVCFTLTPDGSELVETGARFVGASGCPDGAIGTDHSFYPGKVDRSGHVENSHGFTATIRDAKASGVVADSEICPGKKFRWSARRAP